MTHVSTRRRSAEELANSLTHGAGLILSIAGFATLLSLAVMHGSAWRIVSCAVYGSTLVCLYTASTLYHSIRSRRLQQILKVCDHSAIYLLIAGTYTPFLLVNLRGGWGWSLFGIIWGGDGGDCVQGVVCGPFFCHVDGGVSSDGLARACCSQTHVSLGSPQWTPLVAGWRSAVHGGRRVLRVEEGSVQPRHLAWLCSGGKHLPLFCDPLLGNPSGESLIGVLITNSGSLTRDWQESSY